MRVVIQRTDQVILDIDDEPYSEMEESGLLLLLGYESGDNTEDIEWAMQKILNMRIFPDDEGKMNKSVQDINGHLMLVSQFTLFASTKKGNRPSFIRSAKPDEAIPLYEETIAYCRENYYKKRVHTGVFGANMNITFNNHGPVTIILDTKNRE